MATLTAWKFDEPEAAAAVRDKLVAAQKQQLIETLVAAGFSRMIRWTFEITWLNLAGGRAASKVSRS